VDRLTALDAGFLEQERGGAHMHIGAVMVCAGPAPSFDEFAAHVARRLERVPRYRRRLGVPTLGLGRPTWIDDGSFAMDRHLGEEDIGPDADEEALFALVSRVFARRLDRRRPLWELWLVRGLTGGRFAILNKTHHAMVDGLAGVGVTTALFDLEPDPAPEADPDPWRPRAAPSPLELAVRAAGLAAATPVRLGRAAAGAAVRSPQAAAGAAYGAAAGVADLLRVLVTGEPRSPLNGPVSPRREIRWLRTELDDLKAIKNALGGTVNDAFLTVVAGALGRWLRGQGVDTGALALRALVPVSVRTDAQDGAEGNRLVGLVAPLPVDVRDPAERMRIVTEEMEALKDGHLAEGTDVAAGLQELAPPGLFGTASSLQFSSRLYNLLVSNVAGPPVPVYVLGRRLEGFVPIAFLAPDKRLAVAIVSYDGAMFLSLVADPDAIADLTGLEAATREALAELRAAAAAAGRPGR
jgi:WS/DGAT/MGAT family acyltransferase